MGLAALGCGAPPETGRTSAGIHYEVEGRGPAVVLAHGFSMDRRAWEAEVAQLRSDHRVIRYDLRGHGLSDPPAQPFTAHGDMLSVLDALDVPEAVIVGLSAGAQIAIDFAIAHPNRVRALVLASPGLGGYQPVDSFDWMAPVMEALQAGEPERATELWTETPLMRVFSDSEAHTSLSAIVLDNWRIWTYDPQLQQQPDPPAIGRLGAIASPTLVVVGDRDLLDTRRVADTLAACIPYVELVTLPDAGHIVNVDAPAAFMTALASFLDNVIADTRQDRPRGVC